MLYSNYFGKSCMRSMRRRNDENLKIQEECIWLIWHFSFLVYRVLHRQLMHTMNCHLQKKKTVELVLIY